MTRTGARASQRLAGEFAGDRLHLTAIEDVGNDCEAVFHWRVNYRS